MIDGVTERSRRFENMWKFVYGLMPIFGEKWCFSRDFGWPGYHVHLRSSFEADKVDKDYEFDADLKGNSHSDVDIPCR